MGVAINPIAMPFNEENGLLMGDSDAYFGGQMRTYAMWCNQKLALAGNTDNITFNEKAMCQKFQDGTFIATMLQILESGLQEKEVKIRGIKWTPKKLKVFWNENMRICWEFMRVNKITLGGVNFISIMGGRSMKTVLALVWRWIQRYDMATGVNELLQWVNDHTVATFTNNWSDGMAFVELYSELFSCVETTDVESWRGHSAEERMTWAFEQFTNKLNIPEMLMVEDLQTTNIDASQVQTYVATIRTEWEKWHAEWLEEEQKRKDAENNEDAKKQFESEMHETEGDNLFNFGISAFSNQKSETDTIITEIINEITDKLSEAEPPVDYTVFTQEAKDKFRERTDGFDDAIEKFSKAKDEYDQVTHTDVTEKKDKCDEKTDEVNKYRDEFDVRIETTLEEYYQTDRADKFYNECTDHMDTVFQEGGDLMQTIITETTESIESATREEERERIRDEGNKRVEEWIVIFDPLKDEFTQAEDMYPDSHVDDKHKCQDKRDEIDDTVEQFKEMMRIKIEEAMTADHDNDEVFEDELLQLYHETTVHNNETVGGEEVLPLEQLLQNPTKCKERLDEILEKVKGVWGDSESLRQKVHDQVDAVFNANGYECKNGTDCCAECKSGHK